VKKDDDQFRNIGTKPQLLTLKKENMKLLKRIAKLEAENVTLQKRIKVLKKRAENKSSKLLIFQRNEKRVDAVDFHRGRVEMGGIKLRIHVKLPFSESVCFCYERSVSKPPKSCLFKIISFVFSTQYP